jgi:hypothetical protein
VSAVTSDDFMDEVYRRLMKVRKLAEIALELGHYEQAQKYVGLAEAYAAVFLDEGRYYR